MSEERYLKAALGLQKLGVSQSGSLQLMNQYPLETIERQLFFLPMRKAKRPSAFIVDAIRFDYSPPKEFYAKTKTQPSEDSCVLDQDAELSPGFADADTQGHGIEGSPDDSASNDRMEQRERSGDPAVPGADQENWPTD